MGKLFKRYKKIRSSICAFANSILILLSVFFAISCTNIENGVVSKKTGVSVVITNYNQINGLESRSISPDSLSVSDIDSYTITGEDLDGNTLSQAIDIASDGTGTLEDVTVSVWVFTLHAYKDSKEVMCGCATVDTRSTWEVSFTLSSEGVSATGNIDLSFTYSDSTSFASVSQISLALCDVSTLNAVYDYGSIYSSSDLALWTSTGYELSKTGLASASYCLLLTFYGLDSSSYATKIGTYSDIITVEPNRTTSASISITGDILYQKPDAPTNFCVYRDESSLSADYYTAVFRWDDNALNEEYNILKVYTYSNATNTVGTDLLTIDYTNQQSLSIAAGDAVGYIGGSLLYSSEEYALKLKTGILYEFELCAANSMGTSAYVSRSASSDISSDSSYGDLAGFGLSSEAPYIHVNTFSVKYHYNGGTLRTATASVDSAQSMYKYYIYEGSNITLFQPETISDAIKASGDVNDFSTSDSYPVLYFGTPDYYFTKWSDVSGASEITSASSCTNLIVYAQYYEPSEITISLESGVTFTYGTSEANSYPTTGSTLTSSTSISTGAYVTMAVATTGDYASNHSFTSLIFYVNGYAQSTVEQSSFSDTVMYTFAIPFKGDYTLQVAGRYSGANYYSQELVFSVN